MDFCPVTHAKAYPFAIPEGSYVFDHTGWRPLDAAVDGPATRLGRTAVIASGSNASPERLAAKFAHHQDLITDAPIIVECARLDGFDSVYSAHISRYGSIPATLAHVPGAVAEVFVTWLTDAQLEHMHGTEAVGVNYDFCKIAGISLHCESSGAFTSAFAYISKRGCLNRHGLPIPLAATTTEGRQGLAMTQTEVLDFVRAQTSPNEDSDDFIRQHIDCPQTRQMRTEALSQTALKHGWPGISAIGA